MAAVTGWAMRARSWPTWQMLATAFAFMGIAIYLGILTWYMQRTPYTVWGGLLLAPVLVALPVPLVLRAARRDPDPRMVRLIIGAMWIKLFGTVARYYVVFHLYGSGDASGYDRKGALISSAFRSGQFGVDYGSGGLGTRFIQVLTGGIYTIIGPNKIGGFIVFSWLSFLGLYLFYKAFRLAFPSADHHRYALLLFFLPSLAYWPSSLGKEAWMMLGIGLSAYGIARLLARRRGAFLITGLGLWATAMVRPHITLIIMVSLVAGYLLRRSTTRAAVLTKVVGLAIVVAASFVVLSRAQGFFGLDKLDAQTAGSVLDEAQSRSGQGGSAFSGRSVRSPIDLPPATITVLFRPFPFEARNLQTVLASFEGAILAVVCVGSVSRLRRLPRELLRTPYVSVAVTFTVLFVVAFSNIHNFGILARERVQMFPILLVLLCLPPVEERDRLKAAQTRRTEQREFHTAGRQ